MAIFSGQKLIGSIIARYIFSRNAVGFEKKEQLSFNLPKIQCLSVFA
jgi:hypothetical protein